MNNIPSLASRQNSVVRTAEQLASARAADVAANGGDGENVRWSAATRAAESAHAAAVRREAAGRIAYCLVQAHRRAIAVRNGAPITEREAEIARSLRPWHPTVPAALLADAQQTLFGWPGFAPGQGWISRRLANVG